MWKGALLQLSSTDKPKENLEVIDNMINSAASKNVDFWPVTNFLVKTGFRVWHDMPVGRENWLRDHPREKWISLWLAPKDFVPADMLHPLWLAPKHWARNGWF